VRSDDCQPEEIAASLALPCGEQSIEESPSGHGQPRSSRFKSILLADPAVTFATLASITPMLTGAITVLLIATRFTAELQGYYYTFGSLTALQYLFEMGLGQAVIQFASHEWASLKLSGEGRIVGDPDSLSRLVSLGKQAFRWYLLLAASVWIVLSAAGAIFFSRSADSGIHWSGPWLCLCFCLGLNLLMTPLFYLLQGCNQVSEYWFYRFIQQVLNGLSLWLAILIGAKLWTAPAASAVGLIWSVSFLLLRYKNFVRQALFSSGGKSVIDWRSEVWPVQWKIVICWFSVYFTPQLFVPMLFKLTGPIAAGQMGIMVTVGGVLLGLSSNWVVTKAPLFGILIAKRKFEQLDEIFSRSFKASMAVAFLSSLSVLCCIWAINYLSLPLARRILPPPLSAIYIGAGMITIACVNLSTYLRAHKKEPLAAVYFVSTLCVAATTYLLCAKYGALGLVAGYLAVLLLIQLPLTMMVFRRSRTAWH
jgi:hypothetical protein